MVSKILVVIIIMVASAIAFNLLSAQDTSETLENTPTSKAETDRQASKIIAKNLNIPWEIAFLPDGEILVTERPGNLLKIKDKTTIPIEGVQHIGEGGLLGMAIHPKFVTNHWMYLYHTTKTGTRLTNVVERYKLEDTKVTERKVILEGIAAASNHDGGRIAFGPDGYLYITTGDAENTQSAQNTTSLNGKILRITDEGKIPSDNPFKNAVYSYGHRNPQGITWDTDGNLWATEHGRSFPVSGLDELNKIEKGKNYGWPTIQGDDKGANVVSPLIHSGSDTWAPAGAAFYDGKIFFAGLRGEALYEYTIADGSLQTHFKGKYGRIRAVVLGPDKNLYISTSNRDGRGAVKDGDDKVIWINPEKIK